MARLKLPAYGRQLLALRESGNHPESISILYGSEWSARANLRAPVLCVDESFEPGVYDWTLVVFVPVSIHLLSNKNCFDLVAEIALIAAPVTVVSASGLIATAPGFLYHRKNSWRSSLWGAEQDAAYEKRAAEYYDALLADLSASSVSG